jgi:hypothetical protein
MFHVKHWEPDLLAVQVGRQDETGGSGHANVLRKKYLDNRRARRYTF